ncbi:hypothetical protein ASE95_13535 [Sphingomonas sp. Leaf231]|nr:hypothetical protein ASE95_13535 [Sphingomonas sp. Leaf231]
MNDIFGRGADRVGRSWAGAVIRFADRRPALAASDGSPLDVQAAFDAPERRKMISPARDHAKASIVAGAAAECATSGAPGTVRRGTGADRLTSAAGSAA